MAIREFIPQFSDFMGQRTHAIEVKIRNTGVFSEVMVTGTYPFDFRSRWEKVCPLTEDAAKALLGIPPRSQSELVSQQGVCGVCGGMELYLRCISPRL